MRAHDRRWFHLRPNGSSWNREPLDLPRMRPLRCCSLVRYLAGANCQTASVLSPSLKR